MTNYHLNPFYDHGTTNQNQDQRENHRKRKMGKHKNPGQQENSAKYDQYPASRTVTGK
jgi:hypothetical protein